VLLALGIISVAAGSLILLAGQKNRTPSKLIDALFLYVGALMMTSLPVVAMEYFYVAMQHSGLFYRVLSMIVPATLAAWSLRQSSCGAMPLYSRTCTLQAPCSWRPWV